jgi:hypothetical protein
MSEEKIEKSHHSLSFLIAVLWARRTLAALGALALTWWATGDESWFEDPLPERLALLLITIGMATGILACTGVLRLGSARLSEAERTHLRGQTIHPLEAAGLSE